MYAPTGLIAGNPNLEPEKVYDTSVYGIYDVNSKLRLNLDLYYAHMSKAILYLQNSTTHVFEPTNADHVHRGGVGFSMDFRPSELFESKTRVDYLWTRIVETNSPFPGATPLAVSIDGRVGKERGIFGRLNAIMNAGSSLDLNGTLFVNPYVLVNASVHVPLIDHARVIFSVTNIADVPRTQQPFLFPTPGREFFVTLELFS
jgi:outer membrane receptor protein involved in Fe transport